MFDFDPRKLLDGLLTYCFSGASLFILTSSTSSDGLNMSNTLSGILMAFLSLAIPLCTFAKLGYDLYKIVVKEREAWVLRKEEKRVKALEAEKKKIE